MNNKKNARRFYLHARNISIGKIIVTTHLSPLSPCLMITWSRWHVENSQFFTISSNISEKRQTSVKYFCNISEYFHITTLSTLHHHPTQHFITTLYTIHAPVFSSLKSSAFFLNQGRMVSISLSPLSLGGLLMMCSTRSYTCAMMPQELPPRLPATSSTSLSCLCRWPNVPNMNTISVISGRVTLIWEDSKTGLRRYPLQRMPRARIWCWQN